MTTIKINWENIDNIYSRLALVLFGILIGWILSSACLILSFWVFIFGMIILGVVYTIHRRLKQ